MKILVPTDFSALSLVAVNYAARMAKALNAELVLLHAVFSNAPPRAQSALKMEQILTAVTERAEQSMEELIQNIRPFTGPELPISHKIIKNYPLEEVIGDYAANHDVNLIIMGTKGASGLKKVFIGSNTAALISISDIPVLAVPVHARFRNLKHIVYASDMVHVGAEVERLISFARLFKARVHILHVMAAGHEETINPLAVRKELIAQTQYSDISVHISTNEDVEAAIDEYLADVQADMLSMFTHRPTFFEKLFGQSTTREMAFHTWVPLLAFKKQNA